MQHATCPYQHCLSLQQHRHNGISRSIDIHSRLQLAFHTDGRFGPCIVKNRFNDTVPHKQDNCNSDNCRNSAKQHLTQLFCTEIAEQPIAKTAPPPSTPVISRQRTFLSRFSSVNNSIPACKYIGASQTSQEIIRGSPSRGMIIGNNPIF